MNLKKLLELASSYLEENTLGVDHTVRVFNIAKRDFDIPSESAEFIFASIILHDIGGNSIKEQYKKGPVIARLLLHQLNYDERFIQEVCEIIKTHHEHLENPSLAFRILYDSDKLVMLTPEEFPHYDSKPEFNWNAVIDSMYHEQAKEIAEELLRQRRMEFFCYEI